MLRYPAEAVHAASRARQAQPDACRLVTERKILRNSGDNRSMKCANKTLSLYQVAGSTNLRSHTWLDLPYIRAQLKAQQRGRK